MKKAKAYLVDFGHQVFSFSVDQLVMMLVGNLILAMGLAMYNKAAMGNHPFHTMIYAASQLLHGDIAWYSIIFALFNVLLFIIVMIFGKKHIGLGSIVNMLLLGYGVTLCGWVLEQLHIDFSHIDENTTYLVEFLGIQSIGQLLLELAATVCISLGISVYQAGHMGAAPYDALPLIAEDHGKSYAPFRILSDGGCCLVTLLLQLIIGFSNAPVESRIGLGTVITVFCTGPFIRFFDNTVSRRLAKKQ